MLLLIFIFLIFLKVIGISITVISIIGTMLIPIPFIIYLYTCKKNPPPKNLMGYLNKISELLVPVDVITREGVLIKLHPYIDLPNLEIAHQYINSLSQQLTIDDLSFVQKQIELAKKSNLNLKSLDSIKDELFEASTITIERCREQHYDNRVKMDKFLLSVNYISFILILISIIWLI